MGEPAIPWLDACHFSAAGTVTSGMLYCIAAQKPSIGRAELGCTSTPTLPSDLGTSAPGVVKTTVEIIIERTKYAARRCDSRPSQIAESNIPFHKFLNKLRGKPRRSFL